MLFPQYSVSLAKNLAYSSSFAITESIKVVTTFVDQSFQNYKNELSMNLVNL